MIRCRSKRNVGKQVTSCLDIFECVRRVLIFAVSLEGRDFKPRISHVHPENLFPEAFLPGRNVEVPLGVL